MRSKQFEAAKAAPFPGVAALIAECEALRLQFTRANEKIDSLTNNLQQQLNNLLEIIEQMSRSRESRNGQTEKQPRGDHALTPLMKIKEGKGGPTN